MTDAYRDIISTLNDKHLIRLHPIYILSPKTNSLIQVTTHEIRSMIDYFPVASDDIPVKFLLFIFMKLVGV